MCEANKMKFIPPSDYDRSITKSFEKRKSVSLSDVPQLGAQKKQSIEPLIVLNQEQQELLAFLKSLKLTTDQITRSTDQVLQSTEFPIAPMVRWPYKEGTSLVPPEIVHVLPMQMRRLHDSYMKVMADINFMQGATFTDDDFLRGEGVIWFNWEEVYQLYHQDALDISIVSLWLL
jgi:hypothetical protein